MLMSLFYNFKLYSNIKFGRNVKYEQEKAIHDIILFMLTQISCSNQSKDVTSQSPTQPGTQGMATWRVLDTNFPEMRGIFGVNSFMS